MATLLARGEVDGTDLPLLAALACEIHGHAALMASERYGSRGVRAGDVIDMIGLAVDAVEERAMMAGLEYE